MSAADRRKAIAAINARGALLVYPLQNRKEPRSLWSELYPRSKMEWAWDADADGRVSRLWILREDLSRSREVVYAKWFQNRATFFSREVFTDLLAFFESATWTRSGRLARESQDVLDVLTSDSPLSTKQLKAAVGLEGRLLEPSYTRALKPLWQRLCLVGFGEFEDSSFPSLGVGATAALFEDLWTASAAVSARAAEDRLRKTLGDDNLFLRYAQKLRRQM